MEFLLSNRYWVDIFLPDVHHHRGISTDLESSGSDESCLLIFGHEVRTDPFRFGFELFTLLLLYDIDLLQLFVGITLLEIRIIFG